MSALVPSEAVALLYRRYLKAANSVPNVTIRMLLLQQIRSGFYRHRSITSASAQRELIKQAHKDLQILEDERLSRTLFINRLGIVSCLDWEVRRTEYNFTPGAQIFMTVFLTLGFLGLGTLWWNAERIEKKRPDVAEMVDTMAMRLEANSVFDLKKLRGRQEYNVLEREREQARLEQRVLETFYDAPRVAARGAQGRSSGPVFSG